MRIEFDPLANVLASLMQSGGKRIRPALAILSSKFYPADADKVVTLAVAVELVHAATLIHDDLIDKSAKRRGSPTINSRWSATATVLAGDYLLARAAEIAASIENFRLMRIFAQTLMKICVGEIRQDFGGAQWPPDQQEYFDHIDSKTATLFSACTEGGAILSGASEPEIDALKKYGHDLGMAFQIADDLLDFTADESKLGKPVGSDLRQGTFTLPVFFFIAQDARGVKLKEIVQNNGQNSGDLDALID
ncbi:MAG: polyprenyl synthetase family protein [Chloroflexi bacterium]|nr:polyprenyl synthetase family protein [Chloroflexota bacterium]